MQFVDKAKIIIKAGDGGDGCASFHREKFVMRGGPDGGDGGRGGSVVFLADPNMSTLLDFRFARHYRAAGGENGRARMSSGKNGEDLVIHVPVGTLRAGCGKRTHCCGHEQTKPHAHRAPRWARRTRERTFCNAYTAIPALCTARTENVGTRG